MEVIAGASWKLLPDIISYEATVPITYTVPWLGKETYSFTNLKNNCIEEGDESCKILNQMEDISKTLNMEVNNMLNYWNITYLKQQSRKRRALSLSFIADGLNWCCGVATQQKFDSMVMDTDALKTRITSLHEGLESVIHVVGDELANVKTLQETTITNLKTLENKIKKLEDYAEGNRNNIHSVLITIQKGYTDLSKNILTLTKAIKIHDIIKTCRDHQIPPSVIAPAILRGDLKKLNKKLSIKNYELTVSAISDLSKYYELPISECNFAEDELTVHIKAPINKIIHKKWQLFELVTFPFAWQGQTCVIEHTTLYLAVGKNSLTNEQYTRQITGTGLHLCKPYENKLCYLPRFSGNTAQGPSCATKLFHGATVQDLSTHCPLRCHQSDLFVITETDEDVFVLTHPEDETNINCADHSWSINKTITDKGALRIQLPCDCSLQEKNKIIIPPRFPCKKENQTPHITHILPAAWTHLKTFILNPLITAQPIKFKNINECLNHNWSLTTPHINITSSSQLLQELTHQLKNNYKNYPLTLHTETHSLMLIWNTILTIILLYILFHRRHILATAIAHQAYADDNQRYTEHTILFFTTLCLLLIFTTYLAFKLIKHYLKRRKNKNPRENTETYTLEVLEQTDNNILKCQIAESSKSQHKTRHAKENADEASRNYRK